MARYISNTVVLAKIEAAQYTDSVPTGAANAVLVANVQISALDAQNVDRNVLQPWFGQGAQLVGPASKKISFDVDLAGSGTAGTKPAYDDLLQACAFASNNDAALATPRWSYTPVSTGLKSVTLYVYDDGLQHVFLGCMGSVDFALGIGDRPVMKFSFVGRDGGDTAVANPGATLTGYKVPLAVTNANSGQVTVGAAYASAGANWGEVLAGGTAYGGTGIASLAMNNNVQFTPLLGGDQVDVTNRGPSGSLELDLSAAQEASFMVDVKANTLRALHMTHGTASGNRVALFMPAVQLTNPKKIDKNGRRLIGFDLRACTIAGNDEVRLMVA